MTGRISNITKRSTGKGKPFYSFKVVMPLYEPTIGREIEVDKFCTLWPFAADHREKFLTEGNYVLIVGVVQANKGTTKDGRPFTAERVKVLDIMQISRGFTTTEEEILATKKEDEVPF
jgi:hypothetical protein